MTDKISVEELKNVWSNYQNTPIKTEELKLEILQKIKENPSDLWTYFFHADRNMVKRISLSNLEEEAKKSKERYIKSNNNEGFLEIVVMLAEATCKYQDDMTDGIDQERADVWKTVFSDVSEFASLLDEVSKKHMKKSNERKDKYKKKQEELKSKQVVNEIVKLSVSIVFKNKDIDQKTDTIPQVLIDEIIEHYNSFELHYYMKLPFICASTQLEINEKTAIFSFNVTTALSDKEKEILKKELLGQLSDGWGNSLSQRSELVGSEVVSLEFLNQATFENIKTNKLKP